MKGTSASNMTNPRTVHLLWVWTCELYIDAVSAFDWKITWFSLKYSKVFLTSTEQKGKCEKQTISLMPEPHYPLFVPPVRRMMSPLIVSNTGHKQAVYHHYSLHYLYNMTCWWMLTWPDSPLSCCKYADHYSVPVIWQDWNVTRDWEIVGFVAAFRETKGGGDVNNFCWH